jgi:multidrug efflux pump subunit AcrA (membrane-fusion protein)
MMAVLLVSGCSRGHGEEAATEAAAVPVRTEAIVERSFRNVIGAAGQWRSSTELVLNAPIAGMLEALTANVGDRLGAGQRVGTLVPRDSWAGLTGAQLLVSEAHDPASRAEAARALVLARRDLVRLPVTSSQAGVVVRRSAEPGAQIAEAAEILAVAPWKTVVFEAHVPAASASRVHAGEPADITDPGQPPRAAVVQRVLPTASSADQTTLVWLAPRTLSPPPALDRFGDAVITIGPPRRALAVPDSAVVEDDLTGARRVAIVDAGGKLSWKTVTVGLADGGWREVSGPGLVPGTRVVTQGQRGLPEGTLVKSQP